MNTEKTEEREPQANTEITVEVRVSACSGEEAEQDSTKELGIKGENAACAYLQARGYTILERNWTCRYGEADIIALSDTDSIVFVEVKTRRGVEAGVPEAAITVQKRAKYERIALMYLAENHFEENCPVRFDSIGLCVERGGVALLRHVKGAFSRDIS